MEDVQQEQKEQTLKKTQYDFFLELKEALDGVNENDKIEAIRKFSRLHEYEHFKTLSPSQVDLCLSAFEHSMTKGHFYDVESILTLLHDCKQLSQYDTISFIKSFLRNNVTTLAHLKAYDYEETFESLFLVSIKMQDNDLFALLHNIWCKYSQEDLRRYEQIDKLEDGYSDLYHYTLSPVFSLYINVLDTLADEHMTDEDYDQDEDSARNNYYRKYWNNYFLQYLSPIEKAIAREQYSGDKNVDVSASFNNMIII